MRFWQGQLELAERQDRDWIDRGRLIVERYRDERNNPLAGKVVRYNILWSNVETLKPFLYGRSPNPDVARRHEDESDPAGRARRRDHRALPRMGRRHRGIRRRHAGRRRGPAAAGPGHRPGLLRGRIRRQEEAASDDDEDN